MKSFFENLKSYIFSFRCTSPAKNHSDDDYIPGEIESCFEFYLPEEDQILSSLLAVTVNKKEHKCISSPISLKLSIFNHKDELLTELIQQFNSNSEVSFLVHTHLIDNGNIKLTLGFKTEGSSNYLTLTNRQYRIYNFGRLYNLVKKSLINNNVNIITKGLADSSLYNYEDLNMRPWFDTDTPEKYIKFCLDDKKVDVEKLYQFAENGYMILEDFIDEKLINQINQDLDKAISDNWQGYTDFSSQRLEGLHKIFKSIHCLWKHPDILQILKLIFNEDPIPCQTLAFIYGSQQDAHQDTIHLTSFPAGYMCGVWVALEDVKPGSGELFYYPQSHKEKRIYMKEAACPKVKASDWSKFAQTVIKKWELIADRNKTNCQFFYPKKGTVLIWHENLMHGGAKRINNLLSRRSIVSHYFANGALIYFDSTGLVPYLHK